MLFYPFHHDLNCIFRIQKNERLFLEKLEGLFEITFVGRIVNDSQTSYQGPDTNPIFGTL